ncbi:MAG: threonine synthase [Chloroflexi bacterium]|nr:MAG: threonine synthase [Chloroflexota bacterium]
MKKNFNRESLAGREKSLWRYREVLPDVAPVSLGEGFTPMLPSRREKNVFIKDEGLNPTGSFKARGAAVGVTRALELRVGTLALPTAGNAGAAWAAYGARAAMHVVVVMPETTPDVIVRETLAYGAEVYLVGGSIADAGAVVRRACERSGWYDASTLREPYRIEGKKTMGFELAEQLGWRVPDVIVYPTGGGVGLIGMWKAFGEMEELGWIGNERPKMVAVQSSGCAPIPKAFVEGRDVSEPWPDAATVAAGLRVPKAYGDYIILDILKKSRGAAVAVSDAEILQCVGDWAREEGIFAAPEGAASLAAYRKLRADGFLKASDRVVLFNTGSGIKYVDTFAQASRESSAPAKRNVGGIIGPF